MSSRHTMKQRSARPLAALAAAVAGLGALGGCYEHVVRATGPGSSSVNTWEPNLKEDDSFLSSPRTEKKVDPNLYKKPPPNWK